MYGPPQTRQHGRILTVGAKYGQLNFVRAAAYVKGIAMNLEYFALVDTESPKLADPRETTGELANLVSGLR